VFKYPFSKPDTKKKIPYHKRPWQSADLRYTTTTTTVKPLLRPAGDKPTSQVLPSKWSVLKSNLTHQNGIKTTAPSSISEQSSPTVFHDFTTTPPKNVTSKPQIYSTPTPSPIKIYLKSPLKDSQNKSQMVNNNSFVKEQKKPINTGKCV